MLGMFGTLYAVAFTLGLIRSVEAVVTWPTFETWLSAVSLALIGLRLFFSPEALRQYVEMRASTTNPVRPTSLALWHFPILLWQAAVIYAACFELKEFGVHLSVPLLATSTLALNVLWLVSSIVASFRASIPLSALGHPLIWLINNVASIAVVLAVVLLCPEHGVVLAAGALILNSLIDLGFTADWYDQARCRLAKRWS